MDTQKAIEAILEDYEHQPLQDKRTFRAYMNQPELISLSSTNQQLQSPAISGLTNASYYNFTVNLPRPALDAKSLQLLKAIVPQAQCSIPDYALVFPYYKLRTVPYSDIGGIYFLDAPSYDNLYYIALVPSYIKPEQVALSSTFSDYGYNKTFNDYEELVIELNKACQYDLINLGGHFIANDVSFTYDKDFNKFVFNGLNVAVDYPIWDNTTSYVEEDVVQLTVGTQILYYLCIKDIVEPGIKPNLDPTHWAEVGEYYGPESNTFNNYIIAGYDDPNVQQLLSNIQKAGFNLYPAGIPGQPYVKGQTLARRLGFTWDGQGTEYDQERLNFYLEQGVDWNGTNVLFYNRLRPFSPYLPATLTTRLFGTESIGGADSYTADGYCNLVYSSIISIYTTIIGTSSVDTQRNANLIAMIDMNCGNLGIAFGNNFIDTKLTKIQTDVYSIYIELRDENGEPYYLTNNATTTLLLKLTYD